MLSARGASYGPSSLDDMLGSLKSTTTIPLKRGGGHARFYRLPPRVVHEGEEGGGRGGLAMKKFVKFPLAQASFGSQQFGFFVTY